MSETREAVTALMEAVREHLNDAGCTDGGEHCAMNLSWHSASCHRLRVAMARAAGAAALSPRGERNPQREADARWCEENAASEERGAANVDPGDTGDPSYNARWLARAARWRRLAAYARGETDLAPETADSGVSPLTPSRTVEGWRPIETAPKDGTRVLLFKDDEVYSARWMRSEVMGPVWATPDGHAIFRATHWMPQPMHPAALTIHPEATDGD